MRLMMQAGAVLVATLGCRPASTQVEVELSQEPVTLSRVPRLFETGQAFPADAESVALCVWPAAGHQVSQRWTVLTPSGLEAQVVALADLGSGKTVRLASPWSTDSGALCVQPRWGLPLESPVRRVRVVASTPIVVERIVVSSMR